MGPGLLGVGNRCSRGGWDDEEWWQAGSQGLERRWECQSGRRTIGIGGFEHVHEGDRDARTRRHPRGGTDSAPKGNRTTGRQCQGTMDPEVGRAGVGEKDGEPCAVIVARCARGREMGEVGSATGRGRDGEGRVAHPTQEERQSSHRHCRYGTW
jgi:hypothetical protein